MYQRGMEMIAPRRPMHGSQTVLPPRPQDRVEKHPLNAKGKRPSMRPDLVALQKVLLEGHAVNQRPRIGEVPGIPIGMRFYGKADLQVVGLHGSWLAGITYCSGKRSDHGGKSYAISLVCSGGYEDDQDNGSEMWYTGSGGNDLLGSQRQLADQKLEKGNLALAGNIQLGVPVRVTRGNIDREAAYGKVYIYDGLYDVAEQKEERVRLQPSRLPPSRLAVAAP